MNVLFICSANKLRSKTASDYFSSLFPHINFQSAGTNVKICQQEGTTVLTEELLEWADIIFAMENHHRNQIKKFSSKKFGSKIRVLHIPDDYEYYDSELIHILETKLSHLFKK